MKKTIALLSLATILGTSGVAPSIVASASSVNVDIAQQQVKYSRPDFDISSVNYTNHNTISVTFAHPINTSEFAVWFVYIGTDQLTHSVPATKILDENNNLTGYNINLDDINTETTPNDIIASTLKFQYFDKQTNEAGTSYVINADLINAISNGGN